MAVGEGVAAAEAEASSMRVEVPSCGSLRVLFNKLTIAAKGAHLESPSEFKNKIQGE